MTLKSLYTPRSHAMRVAGFMSGSGTNLRKIIENGMGLHGGVPKFAPYKVVVILSDNPRSNAEKIGLEYNIHVVVRDLTDFYRQRGKPRRDLSVRAEFDEGTVKALEPFSVDVAAYAGYMAIATEPLINAFLGVNVHPADLSIMDNGRRKYTGDHAVRDAIRAGERQLRATTHLIEPQVDYGRILMVSSPINVHLPQGFNPANKDEVNDVEVVHQNRLKEAGDWVIFPRTLEYLAEGKYSQDEKGNLYFENKPIPQGLGAGD